MKQLSLYECPHAPKQQQQRRRKRKVKERKKKNRRIKMNTAKCTQEKLKVHTTDVSIRLCSYITSEPCYDYYFSAAKRKKKRGIEKERERVRERRSQRTIHWLQSGSPGHHCTATDHHTYRHDPQRSGCRRRNGRGSGGRRADKGI